MLGGFVTANAKRGRRALRRYGVGGSIRQAATIARSLRERRHIQRADRAFDEQLGVDTSGIVRLHELGFESENKELGYRYQATPPESFERLMSQIDLGDDLTFIDIGAGKGRALLLASALPFRRIVGVEFSPELVAAGERNIRQWRERHPESPAIELLRQDATTYDFPDEPLLVYMYNPFEEPVMLQVLANLRASVDRSPRRVLLVLLTREVSLETLACSGFAPSTPPELFLPTT